MHPSKSEILATILSLPPSEAGELFECLAVKFCEQGRAADAKGDQRSTELSFAGMYARMLSATMQKIGDAPVIRGKRAA